MCLHTNKTCFSHTYLTISIQLLMRYISIILDKVANYTLTQLEITLGVQVSWWADLISEKSCPCIRYMQEINGFTIL